MTQADEQLERLAATLRESILSGHLEKHEMEQRAVRTALDAAQQRQAEHRTAHTEAHNAHEQIHEVAARAHLGNHESENEAVRAAVTAMDRRLDAMNAIRDQLRDQAASFARKEIVDQVDTQSERRYEELRNLIATEREERRANEGVKRGMGQTTAIIVAAVGLVGTALGIIIILSNVLTGSP